MPRLSLVENAHKHLARDAGKKPHAAIILDSAKEVGPALFYSLLIITVSFLPVFSLEEQSGRLFKPLAYTKTFAMAASAVLAVTIVPVLMTFFVRERTLGPEITKAQRVRIWIASAAGPPMLVIAAGIGGLRLPDWSLVAALGLSLFALVCLVPQRIIEESRNPLSRFFIRLYRPVIQWVLRRPKSTVLIALLLLGISIYPLSRMGSEFMPPLNEGSLLYMPTTLPGISITKAKELLQQTDKIIQSFPEVKHTLGKIGRAETATDPAPLSMIETTITLWPKVAYEKEHVRRFFLRVAGLAQGTVDLALARSEEWTDRAPVAPEKGGTLFYPVAQLVKKAPLLDLARGTLYDYGRTGGGPGPGGSFSGTYQCVDHAHQDPDRYAFHRHQDTCGGEGDGAGPSGSDGPGGKNRGGGRPDPRHPFRLFRAHYGRQLSRFQYQKRSDCPIRPHRRGHTGQHRHGHRREKTSPTRWRAWRDIL